MLVKLKKKIHFFLTIQRKRKSGGAAETYPFTSWELSPCKAIYVKTQFVKESYSGHVLIGIG